MIVDGLALVLVGAGLTAIVVGYERNLPEPIVHVAGHASEWADPVTTGSITPAVNDGTAITASLHADWTREDPGLSTMAGRRVWIDPPRR
jgi:1-acyl-sn-glycerol-3-phosphate acyltransferase